jgi:hypothetical protein
MLLRSSILPEEVFVCQVLLHSGTNRLQMTHERGDHHMPNTQTTRKVLVKALIILVYDLGHVSGIVY